MAKQVIWSPASEEDLQNILEYLQKRWKETITIKFINRVDDTIQLILEDPEIFPIINLNLKVRKAVVTKHNTLYYRATENKIEVIRLFDTRQDPKKLAFPSKE